MNMLVSASRKICPESHEEESRTAGYKQTKRTLNLPHTKNRYEVDQKEEEKLSRRAS